MNTHEPKAQRPSRYILGALPTRERDRQLGGLRREYVKADRHAPGTMVLRYRARWDSPLDLYHDTEVIDRAQHQAGLWFGQAYRPLSDSFFGGSSTRFGSMGYPELMHSDFYMPRFSGIGHELDDNDIQNMEDAQQTLMSEAVLIPFYETIRKTREPIEKEFYERARQRRAQAAQAAKNRSVKLDEDNEPAKPQGQSNNDAGDSGNKGNGKR